MWAGVTASIPTAILGLAALACVPTGPPPRTWIDMQTVATSDLEKLQEVRASAHNPVPVPRELAPDSWARAQLFINKYASMKIQVATEVVVETYNPTEAGKFAYSASKTPSGENVLIEIRCTSSSKLGYTQYGPIHASAEYMAKRKEDCATNEVIAAHYIATGELVCEACIAQ